MKERSYSEYEKRLDEQGATEFARVLKNRTGYDARKRKEKINPRELKFQDDLAKRNRMG